MEEEREEEGVEVVRAVVVIIRMTVVTAIAIITQIATIIEVAKVTLTVSVTLSSTMRAAPAAWTHRGVSTEAAMSDSRNLVLVPSRRRCSRRFSSYPQWRRKSEKWNERQHRH